MFGVHARSASYIAMSMWSPLPVFSRASSAIRIADSAVSDDAMSAATRFGMFGVLSAKPRDRSSVPASACTPRSWLGFCTQGPVWPKALIEQ